MDLSILQEWSWICSTVQSGVLQLKLSLCTNTILNFHAVIARLLNLALGHTTTNTTSCTSIVRVVIPLELPQNPTTIYVIDFTFDDTATTVQWVHIAELRFLEEDDNQCPTPSSTAGRYEMRVGYNITRTL